MGIGGGGCNWRLKFCKVANADGTFVMGEEKILLGLGIGRRFRVANNASSQRHPDLFTSMGYELEMNGQATVFNQCLHQAAPSSRVTPESALVVDSFH